MTNSQKPNKSNLVDESLFNIITYSGKGDTRAIELTDKGLELCWEVARRGKFKKLSGDAIKAMLYAPCTTRFDTSTLGFKSSVINELMDPFEFANDGACIFPDQFQPFECFDLSFFVIDNPKKLGGNWVSVSHEFEIAKGILNNEIENLKARIAKNNRIYFRKCA